MSDFKYKVLNDQTERLSDNRDGTFSPISAIIGGAASGLAPVEGILNGVGVGATFIPHPLRIFNYALWSDDFIGKVVIERSFDGVNWFLVRPFGPAMSPYYFGGTGAIFHGDSHTIEEGEANVQYRFECTEYTSGTIHYRLSQ